jgi:hypothetical protein
MMRRHDRMGTKITEDKEKNTYKRGGRLIRKDYEI